jgi:hypothetical protein
LAGPQITVPACTTDAAAIASVINLNADFLRVETSI